MIAPPKARTFLRGLSIISNTAPQTAPARTIRTACNLNCGAHFCGLNVTVRDNHIVKIEPADFPDERYRRICLKGISFTQIVAHPERLLYPLKQMGARGSDNWQRISWDQALDEISQKMRAVADRYGMKSVMFFPYSGQLGALNSMNGVYLRLASLIGASGNSSSQYGVDSAVPSGIEETLGKDAGYKANDYADLVNSRLILIWGGDPAQSRMNWWSFFLDAKRAGARLVTIRSQVQHHGEQIRQLVADSTRRRFVSCARHAPIDYRTRLDGQEICFAPHGCAAFGARGHRAIFCFRLRQRQKWNWSRVGYETRSARLRVGCGHSMVLLVGISSNGIACRTAFDRLREMLKPYTPAFASEKTGLTAEQIFELAREFATIKPARIFTLYGIDRWHHGATFGRLIATLAAFTGNLGIAGGGAGVDGFPEGVVFDDSFAHPDGKTFRPINPATLADQIVTGQPYPIKATFVAFGNWLNQWPNQNRLINEVLPQLDLLVVADHFMTETARWADYVLPAATLFEREDMVKGPFPVYSIPTGHRATTRRMPRRFRHCRRTWRNDWSAANILNARRANILPRFWLKKQRRKILSLDELRAQGVLRQNVSPAHQIAHATRQFSTATGRVEFYSERLLSVSARRCRIMKRLSKANPDSEQMRRYPVDLHFGAQPLSRAFDV